MANTSQQSLLIAGCGSIGINLGQKLAMKGTDVWGLRRNTEKLPPTISPWHADLLDQESLRNESIPNFSQVLFTATPNAYEPTAYKETFEVGLNNLLNTLHEQKIPCQRLIYVSSTSVFGQVDGSWVDEDSPTKTESFAATSILRGEELVKASNIPYIILRLAGIYGPNRRSYLNQIMKGKVQLSTAENPFTNRIHIEDVVGILQFLLQHPIRNEVLIGVDSLPIARNDFILAMQQLTNAPPPPTSHETIQRKRAKTNKRCRNKKLLSLGYSLKFPTFEEGYRSILEKEHQ